MNYKEAKEFRSNNVEIYADLRNAITSLIEKKKLLIRFDAIKELKISESYQLIFEKYGDDESFDLKRKERLVGLILMDLAEDSMNREFSIDIIQAFEEIDDFLLLIKQPKPRHNWYRHVENEIIECVLLKFRIDNNIDIIEMLNLLSNDEERGKYRGHGKHLFSFEKYFFGILNELDFLLSELYQHISKYSNISQYSSYAKSAIEEICRDPSKAINFYEYGKENGSIDVKLFNITCLIEISKTNIDYAYNEALSFKDIKKSDCIIPLMFFEYDSEDRLKNSFDLIIDNDFDLHEKVRFFCKALEKKVITESLINKSLNQLKAFFQMGLPDLNQFTLWWVGMVDGYDSLKNSLLETLFENNIPFDLNHYFGHYENKKYFFDHLRNHYSNYRGSINNLSSIIQIIHNENRNLFENEVIKLLASKDIYDASLAIEIIKSKSVGLFDLPYLELSEEKQLVVLERITTVPFIFEDLFPSLSKFAETEHESVLEVFKEKCYGYVDAYGSEFIEYSDRFIDNVKFSHFLSELKDYNSILETHFLMKKGIKEFNPYLNYYQPFRRYLEHENLKMAIMQEHIQKNNQGSLGLFKNISVIRGSAFKNEQSDLITKMGKFSSSKLLDKRIYEDPIKYEDNYDKLFNSDQQ